MLQAISVSRPLIGCRPLMELEGRRNEQVKELWGLEPHTVEEDLTTRFLLGPSKRKEFRQEVQRDGFA